MKPEMAMLNPDACPSVKHQSDLQLQKSAQSCQWRLIWLVGVDVGGGGGRPRVKDTWEALTENLDWSVAFRVPDLLVSLFQGIRLQHGNTKRHTPLSLSPALPVCLSNVQGVPAHHVPSGPAKGDCPGENT